MKYVELGNGVQVPAVGQGTLSLRSASSREYVKLIKLGVYLGMSFIDTAAAYGDSETIVGEAIQGIRGQVFLATKFSSEHCEPRDVLESVQCSLKRLRTDYIDLLQVHWPNPRVPIEETMGIMESLVDAGQVRSIGICNFTKAETLKAQVALTRYKLGFIQQEYNLLERTPEEWLLPFCSDNQIVFIAYSPLARGAAMPSSLERLAKARGMTVAQLELKWVLSKSGIIAIPKCSTEAHLRENAAVLTQQVEPYVYRDMSWICETPIVNIMPELIQAKSIDYTRYDPSPERLAESIQTNGFLKPIKVKKLGEARYELTDGLLRYWAWRLAYGKSKPIPSIVLGGAP